MKFLRNGYILSGIFFSCGIIMLFIIFNYPPVGVIENLFYIFLSLVFFILVPRGSWIAKHLRYRQFIKNSPPFPTANDAWEAFNKQDYLGITVDPLFKKWQNIVDSKK